MTGFPTITMQMVDYYREKGMELHILDLRDPESYRCSHLEGAVNLPYEELEERVCELPGDKTLILYCYRGSHSLLACRYLSRLGYHVVNVANGIHCYRGKYLVQGENFIDR